MTRLNNDDFCRQTAMIFFKGGKNYRAYFFVVTRICLWICLWIWIQEKVPYPTPIILNMLENFEKINVEKNNKKRRIN